VCFRVLLATCSLPPLPDLGRVKSVSHTELALGFPGELAPSKGCSAAPAPFAKALELCLPR